MPLDDVDKQVWEQVTNVPKVSKPVAFVAGGMNVILPGWGTMVAACAASENVSKTQLTIGILQFLTSWMLIGWILSIYWGYMIVMKALDQGNMRPGGGAAGATAGGARVGGAGRYQDMDDGSIPNNRANFAMANNPNMG